MAAEATGRRGAEVLQIIFKKNGRFHLAHGHGQGGKAPADDEPS